MAGVCCKIIRKSRQRPEKGRAGRKLMHSMGSRDREEGNKGTGEERTY